MSDESPLYDPIESEPEPEPEPTPEPFASRDGISPLAIAGALLALIVLIFGAWWVFLRPPTDGGDPDATIATAPATSTGTTPARSSAVGESADDEPRQRPPLPPLETSDARVRDDVGGLSNRAEWASWLTPDDLARRVVASVANVAAGESPRTHVQHLAPESSFEATGSGSRLIIDSDSYRRYDLLAEVFESLDIGASVALYHDLEPLFEQAYAEIGDPRTTFRDTLAAAIDQLLAVEVPKGEIKVVRHATHFKYADPELEALSPAAKHLVRMGPANAEKVQKKLRFLRSALDL